ncbi:hypothetical protein [Serratia fonticola]|uniref:hypothetical protein n=1 Tax=Serratia fonticola TaxID=47917 RepID=UPI0021BB7C97|nr:hypothetical protein [Serratia fonticola]
MKNKVQNKYWVSIKEAGHLLDILPNTDYRLLISKKDYNKSIHDDVDMVHLDVIKAFKILRDEIETTYGKELLGDRERECEEYIRLGERLESRIRDRESEDGSNRHSDGYSSGDHTGGNRGRRVACAR